VPIRRVCADRPTEAGLATVLWDGRSATGTRAPGGHYLVRVTARGEDGGRAECVAPLLVGR